MMRFDVSWLTRPINDFCLDCNDKIEPTFGRQELATDEKGQTRRRCGKCIDLRKQAA
jgi:hypothetical protein